MISTNAARTARIAIIRVISMLFLGFSLGTGAQAQGWELSFGGNNEDWGQNIIQTVDHGYLVVGWSESFPSPDGTDQDRDIYIIRTDVDGTVVWQRTYDEGLTENANAALQTEDEGFLVVGEIQMPGESDRDVYLLRIDKDGNELWSRRFVTDLDARGFDVAPAPDGFIIVGQQRDSDGNRDILVIKVDAEGIEQWSQTYGSATLDEEGTAIISYQDGFALVGVSENLNGDLTGQDILLYRLQADGSVNWMRSYGESENETGSDIIETLDGQLAIAASRGDDSDASVLKYSAEGDLLWDIDIDGGMGDFATAMVQLEDGSIVITGYTEDSNDNPNILLAKVSADGQQVLWMKSLGNELGDYGDDIVKTASGGFAITGYNGQGDFGFINDVTLITTDSEGNIRSNYITGRVFHDVGNQDCAYDQFDDLLEGWLIRAEGNNGTFFGTTNAQGRYNILVDTGEYVLSVLPISEYWEVCPDINTAVSMEAFYDTVAVDFPIDIDIACPYLEVDISAPFLAICSDVSYSVDYCNLGTATAIGAYVEVELDENLVFLSTDLPDYVQDGNLFTFQLGNIPSTACGSFTIQAQLPCDGIAEGQATLVNAHIYPDEPCLAPNTDWDGSSVIVAGSCDPDSVRFEVRNVGNGGMTEDKLFFIVEDDFLLQQDTFRLDPDEDIQIGLPKTGSTYRIIAEQSDFHPGMNYPTLAIEGCAEDGQYSTGQVAQFPENDQDPYIEIDVQEAIGSLNGPIEMRGYPKGYRDSLIAANTDITYIIFFSNTGTDTVNRVVIRDTLPAELDIETVRPGVSSHPYTFNTYGNGILKFTFNDIQLLPGSSADEAGAFGYVKYRISQKLDITAGTAIENSAAIFFENVVPRQSNTVRHVVGDFPDFLDTLTTVSSYYNFVPGVEIKIAPNPFMESTVFEIEGLTTPGEMTFLLYDVSGKMVRMEEFQGNRFEFFRQRLNPGLYFYRLLLKGQSVNTGKILVR